MKQHIDTLLDGWMLRGTVKVGGPPGPSLSCKDVLEINPWQLAPALPSPEESPRSELHENATLPLPQAPPPPH